ncbi:MAG: ABC transporter ATP-binding protein [Caldilinea sp.]|nr:ABC transporter ATP-binding protein [Caldilinea sp.]
MQELIRPRRRLDTPPVLAVDNLSVQLQTRQGTARVVEGVSLEVWPGEIVGVIGESGSGKTMTALSILRLMPHVARIVGGDIRLSGTSLPSLSDAQMRKLRGNRMALIPQDPLSALNPVQPIGRQVGEPFVLHRRSRWQAAWEQAVRLLGAVHLPLPETRAAEYPHQFSGGMRQRAMTAMALALEPDLLIADEPTTALDVTIQAQVLRLLGEIRDEHETAILLITHDLGVVAESCDWVYVMYAGRIVEEGPVGRLFAHPSHPYTQALLNATPSIELAQAELAAIPGRFPSPYEIGPGCRFADRCARRLERCAQEPPLLPVAAEHLARCWLLEESRA